MVVGPDRAVVATFYAPGEWPARIALDESAAHHATVKRLSPGDVVRLTSGDGRRAVGTIALLARRRLEIDCEHASIERVPALPHVALWAPIGDRDRMLVLAEKAVELGASAWRSIAYRRSRSVSSRGEGSSFRDKLRLRMVAALEQSGGAWLPAIEDEQEVATAVSGAGAPNGVLLDELGQPLADLLPRVNAPIVLACGPEGGLETAERTAFTDGGWRLASLGPNVLRFETAGIAGLALTRALVRPT